MFRYLIGTSGKFVTIGICIFIYIQFDNMYEKIRDTLEGIMANGQVSSDSTTYLWAKLMSDGGIVNIIHFILYALIFYSAIKIIGAIYTNRMAILELNKITKRNHLF